MENELSRETCWRRWHNRRNPHLHHPCLPLNVEMGGRFPGIMTQVYHNLLSWQWQLFQQTGTLLVPWQHALVHAQVIMSTSTQPCIAIGLMRVCMQDARRFSQQLLKIVLMSGHLICILTTCFSFTITYCPQALRPSGLRTVHVNKVSVMYDTARAGQYPAEL